MLFLIVIVELNLFFPPFTVTRRGVYSIDSNLVSLRISSNVYGGEGVDELKERALSGSKFA